MEGERVGGAVWEFILEIGEVGLEGDELGLYERPFAFEMDHCGD